MLLVMQSTRNNKSLGLAAWFIVAVINSGTALNITVANMVCDAGLSCLPYHIYKSGPAIDLALEYVRDNMPDIRLTVKRFIYHHACVKDVAALAAKAYYTSELSAFIGPGCSLAVDIVGRMVAHWNLPLLSPVATNGDLRDKSVFPTLTRLAYNMDKWFNIYSHITNKFGWEDIAIINDIDYVFFTIATTTFEREFQREGKRVYRQQFDSKTDYDLEDILMKGSERARVFLISCYGNDLRRLMLIAKELGMTDGEYVFMYTRVFDGDGFGDPSWYRGDNLDRVAIKAYESLFVTQLRRPDSDQFLTFEKQVKDRALRDYNFTYGETEVNFFIHAFYDAFILYAQSIRLTQEAGEDYKNAKVINKNIWGHTFEGISGLITIDDNGDRDTDYSLLDMNPSTGEYQVVANYFGKDQRMEFSNTTFIHWPNNAGPPLNKPICGFFGNDPVCRSDELQLTNVLVGTISGTIGLFAVVVFVVYRKFKLESDLNSDWWIVKWADMIQTNQATSGSKLSSFQNSSAAPQTSREVAMYKGSTVVLEHMRVDTMKVSRHVLLNLMQLRSVTCPNLTRFYGLCPEEHHVVILWESCSRGTLLDIVHNTSIQLLVDLKLSLMMDIVAGMAYIHHSPLEFHGRLNSSNCHIDSRFVLKISEFGLESVRQSETPLIDNVNKKLLYVAPELLRRGNFTVSKQQADVYSFSIVLYELMTRLEPYADELLQNNIEDLLEQIRCQSLPCRPSIPQEELSIHLKNLMILCWNPDPANRPSFNEIRRILNSEYRTDDKKNILDILLNRMEQYANNLEGLVEERTQAFLEEKRRSEELLFEILPRAVAEKLKNGHEVEPEAFESVTIYFSDIVQFTMMSAQSTPMQIVDLLNDLYTCFDQIIDNFDVYKVETIGDAYMVVSGLPIRNGNEHVRQIARMSLSILESLETFKISHLPGRKLFARIGLHTGSVCTGVVGRKMPRYCLFGDTVNTASRMESNGEAMKIHVSNNTKNMLTLFGNFVMEERGEIVIKGKGLMRTYWLLSEERCVSDVL